MEICLTCAPSEAELELARLSFQIFGGSALIVLPLILAALWFTK